MQNESVRLQLPPTRAIGVLAALTVAAITLSVSFLLWDLLSREQKHGRVETVSLARMFMEQTEQSFDAIDLVLKGVQERMQTPYGSQFTLDSLPVHLLLSTRIAGMRQISSLFIVDAQGSVINSSRGYPMPQISVLDREYFKAVAKSKADELIVDRPVRGRIDGSWTLHLARRFTDPGGKFRGVIVAAIGLAHFEQIYSFMRLDYDRPIAIYLADGTLVASLPHRENMIGDLAPELAGERLPVQGDDVRMLRHVSGDGGQQAFALGRMAHFPLLVGVTNDEEETLASWRETAVPIALGAGLVSIFIAIVAGYLMREVRREEALARSLREATDRYHHTIHSVMDAIVAVDESHNILLFNPAAERMFGAMASEVIGQTLERLIPVRLRETHARHVDGFLDSPVGSRAMAPQLEIFGLRADGTEFPIESTISHTVIGGKPQLTAVLRDVTERRRAEADLREMNRQLRELSDSLQKVREQERTRIARELHDELGQQLTGLKLELSWLSSRLKDGRQATPDEVDAMRHLLDTSIASVRRISTELRPLILDDLGFGEAVSWQTAEFARRSGLEITLDLQAAALIQDDALATALFRIVQESLTNIVRHAAAASAEIHLVATEKNLVLTVRDNGRGMADGIRQGGIGLVSMRERTTAIGGVFNIRSSPGMGTVIEVTLPLDLPVLAGDAA